MPTPNAGRSRTAPVSANLSHGALPADLDHIREVAARINATRSEEDVLRNAAAILAKEFAADKSAVVIGDGADRQAPISQGIGVDDAFIADWSELGVGFPLAGVAMLRNRVAVVGDVDSEQLLSMEQRAWLRENDVRASWAVPLSAKSGDPLGAIVLLYRAPHRPAPSAVMLCQLYAQHAALALDNARLHDALRYQAIRDGKTGLFTHDYLLDAVRRELGRASRSDRPTALLMIDIDDYKRFNDTYGHVAGDKVLEELGAIIRAEVRDSDTAARFGGEEFSVLLPDSDGEGAAVIAERIRAAVEAHRARVKRDVNAQVTISVGVAVHDGASRNPDPLMEAADAALYDAKRSGKNAVRLAPQPAAGG